MMVAWPPPMDPTTWLSSSELVATARRPSRGAAPDKSPASEDAVHST